MATEESKPISENWLVAVGHVDPKAPRTSLQLDSGHIVSIPTPVLLENMSLEKTASSPSQATEFVIPIITEELVVTKRNVPIETTRLVKTQERKTERLEVPLVRERWEITRMPKEAEVDERYEQQHDGETIVYPRFEERLVTRRALFLVEEIHARKIVETVVEIVEEELVRDVISVERTTLNSITPVNSANVNL